MGGGGGGINGLFYNLILFCLCEIYFISYLFFVQSYPSLRVRALPELELLRWD